MITITTSGSFDKFENWLGKAKSGDMFSALDHFGAQGAAALSGATPVESGATAAAWSYQITKRKGYYSIIWTNGNKVADTSVAVMLQLGHGTGTGGYVQGRDYIMPAIRPIFDQILSEAMKVVNA